MQAPTSDPIPSQCTRSRICERLAKVCFVLGGGGLALRTLIILAWGEPWYWPGCLLPLGLGVAMWLFLLVGFLLWRRTGKRLRELLPKTFQIRLVDLLAASLVTALLMLLGREEYHVSGLDIPPISGQSRVDWWITGAPYLCIAFGMLFLYSLAVNRARGRSGPVLFGHALASLVLSLGVLSLPAVGYYWLEFCWADRGSGYTPSFAYELYKVLETGWYDDYQCVYVFLRMGLLALPLGLFLRRLVRTVERHVQPAAETPSGVAWQIAQWTWCVGLFTASFLVFKWQAGDGGRWGWLNQDTFPDLLRAMLSVVLVFGGTVILCLAAHTSWLSGPPRWMLMGALTLASLAAVLHTLGASSAAWWLIIFCGLAAVLVRVVFAREDRVVTMARTLLIYGLLSTVLLLLPAYLHAAAPDVSWSNDGCESYVELEWGEPFWQMHWLQESFWPLHHGLFFALAGAAVLMVLWVRRRWSNRKAERRAL